MNRSARLAAWLSIASFWGIVPHVMEDVRYGQAANFHMTVVQFEWFSGAIALLTAAAALLCMAGWRSGAVGVLLIGALWSVLGAVDHHRAFQPRPFRDGLPSRVWIWLFVVLEAGAAICAATSLRRLRDGGDSSRFAPAPPSITS